MGNPVIEFPQALLDLCSAGWRPQRVTALLVSVLRMHFADSDKIEASELQNKVWQRADSTGILIEAIAHWKPTTTEKRPSLVVRRNGIKVLRQGINDRMMGGYAPGGAREIYSTYLQGSHTVFCIAGESAEAEILGAEVYRELMGFAPKIREVLNFHKFMVVDVGELALLEEASENFVVPVTVAYVYEEAWEITNKTSGPLMTLDVSITAD